MMATPIQGINHITLRVRDIERSEAFYCDLLGMRRVGERPSMRFYSSGKYIHELALFQDPDFEPQGVVGMMHFCFNAADERGLRKLYRRCRDEGVLVSEGVDHVVMHSFYIRDPDGYIVELGVDQAETDWKRNAAPFSRDYPLQMPDT